MLFVNSKPKEREGDQRKARNEMNRAMIFKNDDLKKLEKKKQVIEAETGKLKHDMARLELDLAAKEKEFKKLCEEEMYMKNELIKMKREMALRG